MRATTFEDVPKYDKLAELKAWMERKHYDEYDAYELIAMHYRIAFKSFHEVLEGEMEMALPFWAEVAKVIGVPMVIEHFTDHQKEILERQAKKPRPKKDYDWIHRNLVTKGNCAINRHIVREGIQKKLAAEGIYTELRWTKEARPKPSLWLLTEKDLTFLVDDGDE